MSIDIFKGKKSARHAREVQRAEQFERDNSFPKWRENPEYLVGKKFLSAAFFAASLTFLFHFSTNTYFGMVESDKASLHKRDLYKVCLTRPITKEDYSLYESGEFVPNSQNFELADLYMDRKSMHRALKEDFLDNNHDGKVEREADGCYNYYLRDMNRDALIQLTDTIAFGKLKE